MIEKRLIVCFYFPLLIQNNIFNLSDLYSGGGYNEFVFPLTKNNPREKFWMETETKKSQLIRKKKKIMHNICLAGGDPVLFLAVGRTNRQMR